METQVTQDTIDTVAKLLSYYLGSEVKTMTITAKDGQPNKVAFLTVVVDSLFRNAEHYVFIRSRDDKDLVLVSVPSYMPHPSFGVWTRLETAARVKNEELEKALILAGDELSKLLIDNAGDSEVHRSLLDLFDIEMSEPAKTIYPEVGGDTVSVSGRKLLTKIVSSSFHCSGKKKLRKLTGKLCSSSPLDAPFSRLSTYLSEVPALVVAEEVSDVEAYLLFVFPNGRTMAFVCNEDTKEKVDYFYPDVSRKTKYADFGWTQYNQLVTAPSYQRGWRYVPTRNADKSEELLRRFLTQSLFGFTELLSDIIDSLMINWERFEVSNNCIKIYTHLAKEVFPKHCYTTISPGQVNNHHLFEENDMSRLRFYRTTVEMKK